MIYTLFSTAPFFVCLLWTIILSGSLYKSDRAKRMLTIVGFVATVLYFCHMYYFNEGENLFFEGLWVLCSLSVYPLYYIYICCLTSEKPIGSRSHVLLLFPAILTAACIWSGASVVGTIAHKAILLLQLPFVGFFGYKHLTEFDCQLQEIYADSDSFASRPVRTLLLWFIGITLTSCIFNIIGRQFFLHNDWLLIIPSILFSVMLFSIFYVGYHRENVIEQLQTDLNENGTNDTEPEVYTSDTPLDNVSSALQKLMEEKQLYLLPNIKIGEIAKELGTCRTYLSTYLNQELGLSFSEYINQQRIDYAKQLITHKKPEKLNQLASLSGFSSEASFYRNFKKFAGMSPEEWAKDNHND